MKSDLTRDSFDQAKHYRGVQQQQGRVQLDADWNEQLDITGYRIETETVDTVGMCGAPLHDDGFRLVTAAAGLTAEESARAGNKNPPAVPAGDLLITAGRFYAGGVLAENDAIVLASAQPELPTPAQLAKLGVATVFPPKTAGTYLAYLDVWPRLRTAIDDPEIREVALGGPDTTTRIKNSWQVKYLPAAAGDDCASPNPAWDALLKPKLGTLAASVAASVSKPGPCIVDPGSGYRRLENQLYRVEVHIGGASLAQTTFKWSRDNGSIVTRWIAKQALSDELEVESTGRDKVLNIAPGHWVELTDDTHEELGVPGTFALVTNVSGNIITIDSAGATGPVEIDFFPKNPKVRRWDSAPAKPGKWIAPDGEKTLNSVAKFELEDGVVVQFGVGTFRTGDYWLIPARTALPFVEWPTVGGAPVAQPPRGVTHHYCKLAIVKLAAGTFTITDCRHLFPPLTELTSLFYVSGESQEATPDPTKPASTLLPLALPLRVGVANGEWPVAGARVRFTVKTGGGTVTPVGPGGVVISPAICDAFTGTDGIASCNWSLTSATPNQEVTAELLDDTDARVHLPVIFHARLNTANLVSYDPECDGLATANTVQKAITLLGKAVHLSAVGGDGQDGGLDKELPLPLRVALTSACDPVAKQKITFRSGRDEKSALGTLTSGQFAAKTGGPYVDVLSVPTNPDGIAECFWKLPKHHGFDVFEAIAELGHAAKLTLEGPEAVRFTANLRSDSDGDPAAIRIRELRLQTRKLLLDDLVTPSELIAGIEVYFEGHPVSPWLENVPWLDDPQKINFPVASHRVCCLTAEVPYPIGKSEQTDVKEFIARTAVPPPVSKVPAEMIVGFRPLVCCAIVGVAAADGKKSENLVVQPQSQTIRYLEAVLKSLKAAAAQEKILMRLLLKGNFIFGGDDNGTAAGWLDGNAYADPRSAELILPSGDGRRGGDFETWFWLVLKHGGGKPIRPRANASAGRSKKLAAPRKRRRTKSATKPKK